MTTLLLALATLGFAAEEEASFNDIRVHQTGGFAGVDVVYEIVGDGKWFRISKRVPNKGTTKGMLAEKDLAALRKAVAAIDWKKTPERLVNPNTADDFRYEIRVTVGKKKRTVIADGLSAGKHPQLSVLLKTLRTIETAKPKE